MTETEQDLRERIEAALERIRPALMADGGDVELAEITEDVASVRMLGACIGCPKAPMTLHYGITHAVRQAAPEISQVVALPWDEDILDFGF
jgi:Fe-S cluster biogenesis protein NfuA